MLKGSKVVGLEELASAHNHTLHEVSLDTIPTKEMIVIHKSGFDYFMTEFEKLATKPAQLAKRPLVYLAQAGEAASLFESHGLWNDYVGCPASITDPAGLAVALCPRQLTDDWDAAFHGKRHTKTGVRLMDLQFLDFPGLDPEMLTHAMECDSCNARARLAMYRAAIVASTTPRVSVVYVGGGFGGLGDTLMDLLTRDGPFGQSHGFSRRKRPYEENPGGR